MSNSKPQTIAIIGGGPAGASLATLLARKGYKTGLFHNDKRPPLLVGESLLPTVIPMLRKLGVEDEIKSFSIHKPGATVCLGVDETIPAFFKWADGRVPHYAYNTPRDLFDQSILNAAKKAGATIFPFSCKLEKSDKPGAVQLTRETLDNTGGFFGAGPDLIVDASGRVRAIARLLEIPTLKGGREDIALFAHLDRATMTDPGNIHMDYLDRGWSWRIPLPGRTSIGIVIHPSHLAKYGPGLESQFDEFLKEDPSLKVYTQGSKRITPVVKYNNYQLISEQMYGPGWVMIGDAAGFTDPIFSTGLYLGMKGAFKIFDAIQTGNPDALRHYQARMHWEMKMWQSVIGTWYTGRLFNLHRAVQKHKNTMIGSKIAQRVQKRFIRIFNGQAVDDGFNMKVFSALISLGALMRNPDDLAIA